MNSKKPRGARGPEASVGLDIARTWAVAYGSAWVLASDLMEPPGLFSDYAKFQVLERAMNRVGIELERQPYNNRTYLYRLNPDLVKELIYGESK
jgi:hypothetical protein